MKTTTHIENVIKTRLAMQSTQKKLEQEFDLYIPNIDSLKIFVRDNLNQVEKKKQFISVVGGPANYKHTELFFKNLVKN